MRRFFPLSLILAGATSLIAAWINPAQAESGLYVGSNTGLTADYGYAFYAPMTVSVCGVPSRYRFLPSAGLTLSFRTGGCPHQLEDVDGSISASFIPPLTGPVDLNALGTKYCEGAQPRAIRFGYGSYPAYRCTLTAPDGMLLSRTILYTGFPSAIEYTQIEIVIESQRPAKDDLEIADRFDEIMKYFMLIDRTLVNAYPSNIDPNLEKAWWTDQKGFGPWWGGGW